MVKNFYEVSCSILGDGMTGKTAMVQTFVGRSFSNEYVATVKDTHTGSVSINGVAVSINVTDLSGEVETELFQSQDISNSDVLIVCYSVTCSDRESFDNVRDYWVPAIRQCCKKKPFILVGTMTDLRSSQRNSYVSHVEGFELSREIGASMFFECSSKRNTMVHDIFQSAVTTALSQRKCSSNMIRKMLGR